jgi:hypothetical protein
MIGGASATLARRCYSEPRPLIVRRPARGGRWQRDELLGELTHSLRHRVPTSDELAHACRAVRRARPSLRQANSGGGRKLTALDGPVAFTI